ncbi:proton myo-inositol cotransporter-like, partial [Physella acuta]|uniref:proton myo-inositol cotransporter-like n=1 Tax=Physella acuta TaxID=109671 RepID=UPI0027DC9172
WHIWKQIFTTPHVRKALFIGCMLQVFQQFCGINTVIYYSGSILLSAGFSTEMAIWLACVPAVFNFLATFIGLWAVESLGRKLVLTLSFLAIAVALCVLCFGFAMSLAESPEANPANEPNSVADECSSMTTCNKCIEKTDVCGYCFLENTIKKPSMGACTRQVESKPQESRRYSRYGRCSKPDPSSSNKYLAENVQYNTAYCPSVYSYFAVGGLMLFVLGFAPGAGPMPWTINAEIYPMWCRGVANSLATTCNWVCNSIVTASFPFMIANFTAWGTFLLFAVICAIAAVFVLIFVPETKDKTLEEIEILFMTGETRERALAAREAHDIRRSVAKEVEIEPKMSVGPTGSSHIY